MSVTSSKGLANQPGENNCFLNCAVQALWHVDVFRESLRLLSGHRCTGPACIFCALKVTFTQLSYSGQRTLMPNILRKALAESFSTEQRFQLGDMDDSAECLDTILQRLHLHLCSSEDTESACEAPHCISHSKFGMRMLESLMCSRCGSTGTQSRVGVERYVQLIHYVVTDALVSEVRQERNSATSVGSTTKLSASDSTTFAKLVQRAGAGDMRDCPMCGDRSALLKRQLLTVSPVLILGLVWHSQQPGVSFLADVVESISTELRPKLLFDCEAEFKEGTDALQLTAMVCYYGRHYSAFCRNNSGEWLFFDDDVVRPMGPHWRSVVHRCVRGGYQPLLLLYADPNAQPVEVESALASTVRVSLTQFRREAAVSAAASTSSGSLGRSRVCPTAVPECGGADTAGREGAGDMVESHSRSSSLSEDTLLAGGNPHLHRRLSSSIPTPPPPPEFANEESPPPNSATANTGIEFRRQGSYISAVTERPGGRQHVRRSDSLDSAALSPPASPGSSPIHRRPSCSSSPEGQNYIARQTVETILSLQRQQAAYRRRAAVSAASTTSTTKPDPSAVSGFGTLPKRRPAPLSMPPQSQQPLSRAALQQQPQSAIMSPGINRRPMKVFPVTDGGHDGRQWQFQKVNQHPPHSQPSMQQQVQHLKPFMQQKSVPESQCPQQFNQSSQGSLLQCQQNEQMMQVLIQQQSKPQILTKPQIPVKPQILAKPQHITHQQGQKQPQMKLPMQHHEPFTIAQKVESTPQLQHPPFHQQLQKQLGQKLNQQRLREGGTQPQPSEQLHCLPSVAEDKGSSYLPPQLHLTSTNQLPAAAPALKAEVTSRNPKEQVSKKVVGACPTCGIADSWTIDAGLCIRCNTKLPPRSAQPLKSALSCGPDRSTSISSADSSFSVNSVSSITSGGVSGRTRKKKSVTFNEATLGPMERSEVPGSYPATNTSVELCQLCQQRAVSSEGGPAYCSVCQVYLARFVSQAR